MAHIGLDFDGVFADAKALKARVAQETYGVNVPPAAYEKATIVGDVLTADQERTVREKAYGDPQYATSMDPVDGVFDCVASLATDHEITVITSRDGELLDYAEEWLDRQRRQQEGHVPDLTIIGVGYDEEKTAACREADVDAFVDDDVDKLIPLQEVVPHRYHLDVYGAEETPDGVATPVDSWDTLYDALTTDLSTG